MSIESAPIVNQKTKPKNFAYTHYMNYAILLISVSLALFADSPWAQNKDEAPAAEEPKENTLEDAKEKGQETTVSTPKKPQRLPSNTARERIPDSEYSSMKLLEGYLSKDSLLWLDTEYGRFLSLWQKDRSGDAKGALLIIHAEGEHPAWPNTTKPLHDTLPDYGWATLAISLPLPDEPEIPKRTLPTKTKRIIKADNDEESNEDKKSSEQAKTESIANEDSSEKKDGSVKKVALAPATLIEPPKEKKVSAEIITEKRLEAALQFLHDQGQFNLIILGNGSGAIRAHDFIDKITPKIDNPRLRAKLERPVRALILVNGHNQLPIMEEPYRNWFSDPDIPVLDIFFQGNYRNTIDAKNRKILSRQKKALNYKQVRLISLNSEKSWNENILSRRVRSFLDTTAVGIEVNNAKLRRYK
jgi:hypothetical protein